MIPALTASNTDHQPQQQPRPSHFREEYKVAECQFSAHEAVTFNSNLANRIANLKPGERLVAASGTIPQLKRQAANDSLLLEIGIRCRNYAKVNHPRLRGRFLLPDIRGFIGRYLARIPERQMHHRAPPIEGAAQVQDQAGHGADRRTHG